MRTSSRDPLPMYAAVPNAVPLPVQCTVSMNLEFCSLTRFGDWQSSPKNVRLIVQLLSSTSFADEPIFTPPLPPLLPWNCNPLIRILLPELMLRNCPLPTFGPLQVNWVAPVKSSSRSLWLMPISVFTAVTVPLMTRRLPLARLLWICATDGLVRVTVQVSQMTGGAG